MKCRGCGNDRAYVVKTVYSDGRLDDSCDHCGGVSTGGTSIADVYWPGPHSIEHVTDKNGQPIHFTSRAHKAHVFREQRLREVGDRVHGSRELGMHTHPRYHRRSRPDLAQET